MINPFKKFDNIEYALLAAFVMYLVLPIPMPSFLGSMIDTPIGYIALFLVAVFLFFHSKCILAVVFIAVAYELLRRPATAGRRPLPPIPVPAKKVKTAKHVRFSETTENNVLDNKRMAFEEIPSRLKDKRLTGDFSSDATLEESVVKTARNNLGGIRQTETGFVTSSFKPVYDNAEGVGSYV
jgi:hypothetical protein